MDKKKGGGLNIYTLLLSALLLSSCETEFERVDIEKCEEREISMDSTNLSIYNFKNHSYVVHHEYSIFWRAFYSGLVHDPDCECGWILGKTADDIKKENKQNSGKDS